MIHIRVTKIKQGELESLMTVSVALDLGHGTFNWCQSCSVQDKAPPVGLDELHHVGQYWKPQYLEMLDPVFPHAFEPWLKFSLNH